MGGMVEAQVLKAEERLWRAVATSDIPALDELLAPELVFTNHVGQLFGKKDDLAAHASKLFTIKDLQTSEQRLQFHEDVAIVTVRVRITGTYAGNPVEDDLRFTRVWGFSSGGNLHMLAGHSCSVAKA
jgi:ketosteroid isomerase-like protein